MDPERRERRAPTRAGSDGFVGVATSAALLEPSGPTAAAQRRRSAPFRLQLQTGCRPHEYAVLYGVLKARGDPVLARTASGLAPFRRAPIPRDLRTPGTLPYLALREVPRAVIVRAGHRRTVLTERLGAIGREAHELCQGEAEH